MGENFNENLRIARERKGISQKDMAENIGVAKSTYVDWHLTIPAPLRTGRATFPHPAPCKVNCSTVI